jgi:hypothetical protein
MSENTTQGQSEGTTPVVPVDQKTTKATKVAKVKTEAEAREEALRSAMKVGTLREVVALLAIDALILGGTYAAVRAIGHRVCVAYDLNVDWLVHLIEGAISAAVGVPIAVVANKGIAHLSAQQTAKGLEYLRVDLHDQNLETTSRLLAKVQDDNRQRNEEKLNGLRGDMDVALERLGEVRALAALAAEDAATATNRVLEIERRSAERIDEIAAVAKKIDVVVLPPEANATVEAAITSVGKVLDLPVAPTSKKKTASKK